MKGVCGIVITAYMCFFGVGCRGKGSKLFFFSMDGKNVLVNVYPNVKYIVPFQSKRPHNRLFTDFSVLFFPV